MRRLLRWMGIALLLLLVLVASGLLLADHLTPQALGKPSHALPLQPSQTPIDQALAPLLAAHPGKSGIGFVSRGLDAFAVRALSARQAGRSLDLQYYMWKNDLTGHLLAHEVHAAAERGVRVRILLDDMNTRRMDPQLLALDAHPNIELRLYNPFRNRKGLWRLVEMVQRFFSVNYRMHNKAWIADGRVAVVGGRNIGEEYFDARNDVNFRDLDLVVAGPAADDASRIFDRFWNSPAVVPIASLNHQTPAQLRRLMAESAAEAQLPAARRYLQQVAQSPTLRHYLDRKMPLKWSGRVAIVSDPPLKKGQQDTADWLVYRLARELETVRGKALLISPYFVPGDAGSEWFAGLVARGAQVGVVTNSLAANDVPAVHSGYSRYRRPLLEAGVQLYELKAHGRIDSAGLFGSSGASLHTKAFVVDDRRGFVGSFNLDPRSAYLNTEMGVFFDDPDIGLRLRQEYLHLTDPAQSYWVFLDGERRLRWLDREPQPPQLLATEPDTGSGKRLLVWMIGWLPIESQL
ncbi:phospholipase D family protein [Flavobacterium sp. MXW15]|uniref:Phospholipase D family protein n=1 Tax=Xanthomonas chitinilytica TaxID=2989819 RepID=A0ABT3JSY3_9XANT|nr:phospholipase D family protein [Xanthomonas sp. H13-6]MCW4453674.1 phospholipase D family protein [Flavobacterium sp. MXW15]MCW4471275.1 phospholipase D family protein [Xanthomonas sp. H13-6]